MQKKIQSLTKLWRMNDDLLVFGLDFHALFRSNISLSISDFLCILHQFFLFYFAEKKEKFMQHVRLTFPLYFNADFPFEKVRIGKLIIELMQLYKSVKYKI